MRGFGVLGVVIVAVLLIILGPFITIWALDTLFPALNIPYTFSTWLAVVAIGGVFKSNVTVNK